MISPEATPVCERENPAALGLFFPEVGEQKQKIRRKKRPAFRSPATGIDPSLGSAL
jgi:hypothetical protein